MFSVFVSYAHKQVDWATHLRTVLNSPGVTVYVAEHDLSAGDSLAASIARQIKSSDLVILLWTEDARESQYVAKEMFLAKAEDKPIIPVLLQQGVPLPSELGDVKYLDIGKDPAGQVAWLQLDVARRAQSKQISNFVAFGLVAFLAWATLRGDS